MCVNFCPMKAFEMRVVEKKAEPEAAEAAEVKA
jgi:formate hydrogenlyase subunit 6/NADH:ubiquinone oxidoreductase subunit I